MTVGRLFFNDTATTEIYTLSLHDALPISSDRGRGAARTGSARCAGCLRPAGSKGEGGSACTLTRSEEHTSELQSRQYLVCRLLLEKKTSQYPIYTRHSCRLYNPQTESTLL